MLKGKTIGVVIPTYKASNSIQNVVSTVPEFVDLIVVIDDACPENSGQLLMQKSSDNHKVKVIFNQKNKGVGASTILGYEEQLKNKIDVIVKMDSDGQMDPSKMESLIEPVLNGHFDYSKGNRFYSLESLSGMPLIRIIGNAILSLLSKISTGYWNIFDPTNGYTAINSKMLHKLPLTKINSRFFFESDMLFRLNICKAAVTDIDIPARYQNEKSNLKINRTIPNFLVLHLRNFVKRYIYNYVIRDVSVASIEFPLGLVLLLAGTIRGINTWIKSWNSLEIATAGNVVLTSLMILSGIQFILAFLAYDIANVPHKVR